MMMALFKKDDRVLIRYEDATRKITVFPGTIDREAYADETGPITYWVQTNLGVKLLVPEKLLQGVQ
jgi:hypothetical protein